MSAQLVELKPENCMGCGKPATHALEVDGMLKGLYCSSCGGVLVKKDPDNVKAHKEQDKLGTFRRIAPKKKETKAEEVKPVAKVEEKKPALASKPEVKK